jgi:hypothetical protein
MKNNILSPISFMQNNEQMQYSCPVEIAHRLATPSVASPNPVSKRINFEELHAGPTLSFSPKHDRFFKTLSMMHLHAGDPFHGTGKSQRPRIGRPFLIDTTSHYM